MTQKIKGEDLGPKWWGGSTASYVALGVKILLGLVATIVLVRIAGLYTGYLFFLDLLVTGSGMDVMRAKPIAFVLNMLSLALMPMALMYLLFGRGGWKLQTLAAAGGTVVFLWTYFVAEEVYFDRKTGESLRCYARTPAGIRFSSTCDYDPEFGIKYQKITPEIMLELKKSESDAIETTPVASVPPIRKTLDVLAEGSILSNEGKANLELWKWVNDQALRVNVQSEFVNADIKDPGTGVFFPDHIRYTMYVETVFVIRPYVLIALVLTPTYGDDVNVKIFRKLLHEVRDKFARSHGLVLMSLEREGVMDLSYNAFSNYSEFRLNANEKKRMLILVRPDNVEDLESGSVVINGQMSTFAVLR